MTQAYNLSQLANKVNTSGQLDASTGLSGTAPIANGGTNNSALGVTAGGVVYTDGSKLVNSGAGTSGYLLQSNGASAPTWVAAPSGAVANGTMYENSKTVTANYTLTTNKNAFSVGPITIASGVTVTVPSGQRWVVL